MHNIVGSGLLAVLLGGVVAVLAFVPFVAVSYRRRGGLSFGRSVLWAGAAVYFWAIWTYTLVPLPDSDDYRCAGTNLRPFQFIDEIREAVAVSGRYLTDPVVLQVALNVLLFVPLGFFLRVLGGRGILIAGLVGLAVSGVIETTQLTGVWGVFPCAYRVFDVDDLIANTSGALLGSLVAFAVPKKYRGAEKTPDADLPRPVTRGRRVLGILCDVLGVGLLQSGVAVALQAVLVVLFEDPGRTGPLSSAVGTAVAAVVWLAVILATGRSVGDLATRVRYTNGVLPEWLARALRFLTGAASYSVLETLPAPWGLLSGLLLLATLVLLFVWKDGRGLTGWIGRRRLVDDRAGVVTPTVL
ncbi:VanZ family protein [Microbacterium sp. B19]|uniref:VanZ family protein n=1 Tax=Microbacterium sp. B19 TaxID=96765 RepID=UPI000346BD6B|nr:VanZ family protein [Microbacterium sp. B19]